MAQSVLVKCRVTTMSDFEQNHDTRPPPDHKQALRVLLVEDSEFDATLLVRHLRSRGYDTTHSRVENQREMETALAAQQWDVVLCDYHLPKFGVLPALALLKRKGLDLPFIVVSGAMGNEVAVDLMRAGAHDFVRKDRLSGLIGVIERERLYAKARSCPHEMELSG
jgi:CheY-like chemotaxis protein